MDNVRKALPFMAVISIPPLMFIADRTRIFEIFSKKAFEGAEEVPSLVLNREVIVLWFQDIGEKAVNKLGDVAVHPATIAIALLTVIYCIGHYRKEIQKAWNTINPYARIAELETKLAEKTPAAAPLDFTTTPAYLSLLTEIEQLKKKLQTPPVQLTQNSETSLLDQISKLRQQIEEKDKSKEMTQAEIQLQLKTLQESLSTVQQQYTTVSKSLLDIADLKSQLFSLQECIQKLQQQSGTFASQKDQTQLASQLKQLETSLSSVNQSVSGIADLKSQLSSLQESLQKLQQESSSFASQKELEPLTTQFKQLETSFSSINQSVSGVSDLKSQLSSLQESLQKLQQQSSSFASQQDLQPFTAQLKQLETSLSSVNQSISSVADLKSQLSTLQESLKKVQEQSDTFANQQELSNLKERCKKLETQQSEGILQLTTSLEGKISEISSTFTTLSESLVQQKSATNELQTNYGNLAGRVSQLENDIKEKTSAAEIKSFTSQVSSLKETLEQIRLQNKQDSEAGATQEKEREQQMQLLQEKFSKVQDEFLKLTETVSKFDVSLNLKVREKNTSLTTQFTELKLKVEMLQSELQKLQPAPAPTSEMKAMQQSPKKLEDFKKSTQSTDTPSETTPGRNRSISLNSETPKFSSQRPPIQTAKPNEPANQTKQINSTPTFHANRSTSKIAPNPNKENQKTVLLETQTN